MDKHEQIRNALQQFTTPEAATILAIVTAVDEAGRTVTLVDDETKVEYHEVRLRPVLDGNNFITIVPKVNTWCLAVRIEDDSEWMLLSVGEADKFFIKIGTVEFNMTSTGFEMKKGEDDLKQVITMIIESILQVVVMMGNNPDYTKLNQALTKLNNLM